MLLDFQCLCITPGTDNFHLCSSLGFHRFPFRLGNRYIFAYLFLANPQILFGELLFHLPEIGVIVRGDHPGDEELRHFQPILRQAAVNPLPQGIGQLQKPLVNFQNVNAVFPDGGSQIAFHLGHHQAAEQPLATAAQDGILLQLAGGADELEQQLAGIGNPDGKFAGSAQLDVHPGHGVKEADFGIRAPLDAHLGGAIDEIHLAVEGALGIRWQLVELFQDGQLLGFQGVAAGAEQIQRLTVPEEDGLLAFVDDKLRPQVKILDGVLPHQGFVVALIFNDAGKAVPLDFLGFQPFRHIVDVVAHRANIAACPLGCPQPHTALGAGKFNGFVLLRTGVDGLPAHGALGACPPALVKHHVVAAVGTGAAAELVRADINGVAAGAVNLLARKKAGLGFRITPTVGAFDYKFGHFSTPFHSSPLYTVNFDFLREDEYPASWTHCIAPKIYHPLPPRCHRFSGLRYAGFLH